MIPTRAIPRRCSYCRPASVTTIRRYVSPLCRDWEGLAAEWESHRTFFHPPSPPPTPMLLLFLWIFGAVVRALSTICQQGGTCASPWSDGSPGVSRTRQPCGPATAPAVRASDAARAGGDESTCSHSIGTSQRAAFCEAGHRLYTSTSVNLAGAGRLYVEDGALKYMGLEWHGDS